MSAGDFGRTSESSYSIELHFGELPGGLEASEVT